MRLPADYSPPWLPFACSLAGCHNPPFNACCADYKGSMNTYIPGIGNGQLCDAACWSSQTFGSSNSVQANFFEASYGTVGFTSTGSMRVVVNMGAALTSLATGTCPTLAESKRRCS